ncbi:uncharacterized protein LOC117199119 isoform X1 [Orcinus orca]|uniref:uncharacterized protein LOC117199119 isoform X1 n=2 Tax=Orcinus orca TaxID=9733 RepID=UPI001441DA3B|nr:uncharacterized protein LOC117199119 isoform X1 [Orcinus orca]XP_049556355.1 uncharacterized protein LOC117199119 isoform X1 [Orcinus orca]
MREGEWMVQREPGYVIPVKELLLEENTWNEGMVQQWLPFLVLHLVTTMSSTEGVHKHSWAGMGRHTAWLMATGPTEMFLWPRQQRWKQRSQSPDVLPRESAVQKGRTKTCVAPDPKSGDCSIQAAQKYKQQWLPFLVLHLVTTMSSTDGVEKRSWAGMERHTTWLMASGPMAGTPRPGNSTGGMIYTQPHLAGTCSCGGCQLRTAEHFPRSAAVAPVSRPTPGHYHVLYRGCGETQLGWHGETYCLVGGYRLYGDVPLATPAKVEAEKPVPRRALKRKHSPEWSDEDLCCPRPKIRRLELSSSTGIQAAAVAPVSRPTPGHYHVVYRGCGETQLGRHGETYCLVGGFRAYGDVPLATPAKVEAEKPVPRRAPKRKHCPEMSDEDLGCCGPKIRRL